MIYVYLTEPLKQKSDRVLLFSQSVKIVWGNGGCRSLNDNSKPHHHFSWLLYSHLLVRVCVCVCARFGARMLSNK